MPMAIPGIRLSATLPTKSKQPKSKPTQPVPTQPESAQSAAATRLKPATGNHTNPADQRVKHIYRQIIIAVVVVVVVLGAVFGFTGVRASQQMRDLAALNDCKEAVTAMNTSYSKAFQLKAKISEAFTSFDGSYDLDKLAELHQTEVTAPKTLSCAADTSATISKANAAKAEYDKQAKQFKQALQKADESTATDGGDGTDGTD